jgi:transketolase
MANDPGPNYLRLNYGVKTAASVEGFKQWRKLRDGKQGVVIGVGPVLGNILELDDDLEVWAVGILPFGELPKELIASVKHQPKLLTIEEHYGQCGLNEEVARAVINELDGKIDYRSICAAGYPSGRYGSQQWHQGESSLAGPGLKKIIKEWLYE